MKRIPSITSFISFLVLTLSCHLSLYARKMPPLEDRIISKGKEVKLWKELKKEILEDQRLRIIKNKENIELFDNVTKRYVLELARNNEGRRILLTILKNKIDSKTIQRLLSMKIVQEGVPSQASKEGMTTQAKERVLRDYLVEYVEMLANEGQVAVPGEEGDSHVELKIEMETIVKKDPLPAPANNKISQKEGLEKNTIWGLPALYVYGLLGMLLLLVFILCVGVITRRRKKQNNQ
ncbi:MAG: hypothetical protein AAF335_04130 [Bacteroidota bacterium]